MKKFISLFLILNFLVGNVYAAAPIVDDFAQRTLVDYKNTNTNIKEPITDEFATKNLSNTKSSKKIEQTAITDDFAKNSIKPEELKGVRYTPKPVHLAGYDSKEDLIAVVSIDEYVTTRKNIFEGQELNFTVAKDVIKNGKVIIPKGTKVTGRVELITMNGAFGSPADLTIGNFILDNGTKNGIYLDGEIYKKGANRSYWVYPIGAASLVLMFAGLLVLTIRGGHAKIKPNQQYALNYNLPKL